MLPQPSKIDTHFCGKTPALHLKYLFPRIYSLHVTKKDYAEGYHTVVFTQHSIAK